MSEDTFSQLGKIQAIGQLYSGTGYKPFGGSAFAASEKGAQIVTASRTMLEGIDFDLVYFPLQHLGYKSVLAVCGELYAKLAHPRSLNVNLGVSAKLDYPQVKDIWQGIVTAAQEHGFKEVDLDLTPSKNGLVISVSAAGETSLLTSKRRGAAKSKDLICISGRLGAAYMGLRVLQREKKFFESGGEVSLEANKMLVQAYLKPELNPGTVSQLEDAEIYPSHGYFLTRGLADAIKRLSRDSGLGAKVYAAMIPFEGNTFNLGKEMDIDPISAAMNGGDDFQLLFTIPILSLEKFRRDFQTFDIIGHLALPEAGTVLVTPEGLEMPLTAQGWPQD
ncbi:MAG: thiamine-phosphate kinase [Bacteroidales bacterium]|nr:thiamine-phosphate kinase [Bacteroidales bacterium]